MNKYEQDILLLLSKKPFINQRTVSKLSGYSLGIVNQSIKKLIDDDLISLLHVPTIKASLLIKNASPKNAIILAAGFGTRMAPINMSTPKGLLKVDGVPLVERLIKQLHEVGIKDITIVVGFKKEMFDYLIDDYGVKLLYNDMYKDADNIYSLYLASNNITNTFIVPSNVWFASNPFSKKELYSWYMTSDCVDPDSYVRVNRKNEIIKVKGNSGGNEMIGVSYITYDASRSLKTNLKEIVEIKKELYHSWDEALFEESNKMFVNSKMLLSSSVAVINDYEKLRDLDAFSSDLKNKAIEIIKEVFNAKDSDIDGIEVLKKGMTNRSFFFRCFNKRYIMRIPGEGTNLLINRKNEADVYNVLKDYDYSDKVLYINPNSGYKITEFIDNTRNCDPSNLLDVSKCMDYLRSFHDKKLQVGHVFDLFERIEYYESLWNGEKSIYKDYKDTKKKIYELKEFVDKYHKEYSLTHIDAVCDNFLFSNEKINLIDWEYAANQDQDVDIAMFIIYAMYDAEMADKVIGLYYKEGVNPLVKTKIYCYISICGLLWSNWCEYKRQLGVEFGEYSLKQYRFAKDYYKKAKEEMSKCIK